MTRYDRQFAAAAANYDNACDCCDHARRPTGPDDFDLYADGWTPGATARLAAITPTRAKSLAELEAESRAYWGINA